MDLTALRNEIDEIDDALIPLLTKRMEIAAQIAAYKKERGLPVLNEQREREIFDKVAETSEAHGEAVQAVYAAILNASKAVQHTVLGDEKEVTP